MIPVMEKCIIDYIKKMQTAIETSTEKKYVF